MQGNEEEKANDLDIEINRLSWFGSRFTGGHWHRIRSGYKYCYHTVLGGQISGRILLFLFLAPTEQWAICEPDNLNFSQVTLNAAAK